MKDLEIQDIFNEIDIITISEDVEFENIEKGEF